MIIQVDLPIKQFPLKETLRGRLALVLLAAVPALLAYLKRNHYPVDYLQGETVNIALSYMHNGGNWPAAEAWAEFGKRQMTAILRQADRLATEFEIGSARIPWMVGYHEGGSKKKSEIKRLKDEVRALKRELEESNEYARELAEMVRIERKKLSELRAAHQIRREENPLNAAYEEQMRSWGKTIDEIMLERGWVRIENKFVEQSYEQEPKNDLVELEPPKPPEPYEGDFEVDYKKLRGKARNAKIVELKNNGLNSKEIGELFDMPAGSVRSIISRSKM